MDIKEMQEAPEHPWPEMEKMIADITRQYKNGTTKETSYHSQMALLYCSLKNVKECRLHAAKVPEAADVVDKVNVFISLARMMIFEKNVGEAIIYYEKCLETDPEHVMALDEIAWCCYDQKRYTEAEKWFGQFMTLEDGINDYTIWEGMGLTFSAQKRYTEAIPCFTKALELEASKINSHYYEYLIGLSYANENDFYRAMAHYTKSLDAEPRYAPSLNNIGTLYYEHESDIKTAIKYFKQAEEIAETEKDTQILQLTYINLGKLYDLIADYDLSELYNNKLLNVLGFPTDDNDNSDNDSERNAV